MENVFRWERKSIFGYLPFVILFGFFTCLFAVFFYLVIQFNDQTNVPKGLFIVLIGFLPCLSGMTLLFFLVTPIIQILFGYLKMSPSGFEYRRWPFHTIRGRWDEIVKVQQGTLNQDSLGPMYIMLGNRKYATLIIRRHKPGREISLGRGTLGSANYHLVPLSELEGWADGSLAMTLRNYAPHAFE